MLTSLWMLWDHLAPSCPVALHPRPLCVPLHHPIPLPACRLNSSTTTTTLFLHSSRFQCSLLPLSLRVAPPPHPHTYPVASLASHKPWAQPLNPPCRLHPCSLRQSLPARCSSPAQYKPSTPARRWANSFFCYSLTFLLHFSSCYSAIEDHSLCNYEWLET